MVLPTWSVHRPGRADGGGEEEETGEGGEEVHMSCLSLGLDHD